MFVGMKLDFTEKNSCFEQKSAVSAMPIQKSTWFNMEQMWNDFFGSMVCCRTVRLVLPDT
jgi:hypothetical protein